MLWRQLPNLLGLARILATPLLMWLIIIDTPAGYLWAVLVLLLMAVSDYFDGMLARRWQVVSPLGIFLDTISDKIFVAGALLPMVQSGLLSSWVALVIIVREFAVSGLRSYAAAEGQVIAAGIWGKQKLAITVTALIWRLLAAYGEAGGALASLSLGPITLQTIFDLWPITVGLMVFWTIASGVDYFWKAWPLLRTSWAPLPKPTPEKTTPAKGRVGKT